MTKNQNLAFAGGTLNRLSENRNDDAVAKAARDPNARFIAFAGAKPLLRFLGEQAQCWHFNAPQLELDLGRAILLGVDETSAPWLAVPSLLDVERLPETVKAIDLRSIIAQGLIDGEELGNLAYGAALNAWHSNNPYCSKCGSASKTASGGAKRLCPNCNAEHFPRTDPVAIMMVTFDDRCLLGRSPHFPPGMYSCLAGFIEAGETIEDAVRRETFEESGIKIDSVTYIASQPWPMPHSLMIGCFAQAVSEAITFDAAELEDCRWFSKDELREMLTGTHPEGLKAPLTGAIACHLMEKWAAE
ncbi:MAG: NAD(+) diphosphatase [Notoacmeibacter sp.]